MTILRVSAQDAHNYPAGTLGTIGLIYPGPNTAGNCLIATVSVNCTQNPLLWFPTVSDSLSNSNWQMMPFLFHDTGTPTDDNTTVVLAYCWNCLAGVNTVTFGETSGNGFGDGAISLYEYSGVQNASDPFDFLSNSVSVIAPASPVQPVVSDSFTMHSNGLIFASYADEHTSQSGSTYTAGSGYNLLQGDHLHTDAQMDRVAAVPGTYTADIALPTVGSDSWAMMILGLRDASQPAVGSKKRIFLCC